MHVRIASLVVLAAVLPAQVSDLRPGRKYATVERLKPERLAAVRAAREQLAKERRTPAPAGVYNDYKAVMHIHAEDAPHTLGKRAEVLAAAKEVGLNVVMWGDHDGPKPDTWEGVREGILFIAGGENGGKHELAFPKGEPVLRFHSHVEGDMEAAAGVWDGMEIYNRHADAEDDKDLMAWLGEARKDTEKWAALAALAKQYPEELFGAGCDYWPEIFARWDKILATRPFTGIAANDSHQNTVLAGAGGITLTLDPYRAAFRNVITHILARELNEKAIRESLRQGRVYVSHDWLVDATGFHFGAVNSLGVYEMGDTIPLTSGTRLSARAPAAASFKFFHNGRVFLEQKGSQVFAPITEPGAYRVEAWLDIDGEARPWVYSNAIRAERPAASALTLPSNALDAGIEAVNDIEYTNGTAEDAAKHRLDIYRRAGATKAPVLFFVHGGAWVRGDRKQYPFFGNRFAQAGYVVVVPSYRLAPKDPHPAQIEDVAAAFAWTVKNIAEHGGDPSRIFIAGHSAGGHLVALLATNGAWLAKHGLTPKTIRGVMALSGVYNVASMGGTNIFPADAEIRRAASPVENITPGFPRFLVSYCQWDYATLPQQAQAFHSALRKAGGTPELVYVQGENHISEMTSIVKSSDATAAAMLSFMEGLR